MSKEEKANDMGGPVPGIGAMVYYELPRQVRVNHVANQGSQLSRLGVDNYCLDRIGLRSMSPEGEIQRLARLSADPRAREFQAMGSRIVIDPALLYYIMNPDELIRMDRKLAKWSDSSIGIEQEYWNHRIDNFRALVKRVEELTGVPITLFRPPVSDTDTSPPSSIDFFGRDGSPIDTHIERAAERKAAPVKGISARAHHKNMPVHDLNWTKAQTETTLSAVFALLKQNGYTRKKGGLGKMMHSLNFAKDGSPTITLVMLPGRHLLVDLLIDGKQTRIFAKRKGFGDPTEGIPDSLLQEGHALTDSEAEAYSTSLKAVLPTIRTAITHADSTPEAPTVLSVTKVKPDLPNCVQYTIRTCPNGLRLSQVDSWILQVFVDGKVKASSSSDIGTPLTPQMNRILLAALDSGRIDQDNTTVAA